MRGVWRTLCDIAQLSIHAKINSLNFGPAVQILQQVCFYQSSMKKFLFVLTPNNNLIFTAFKGDYGEFAKETRLAC